MDPVVAVLLSRFNAAHNILRGVVEIRAYFFSNICFKRENNAGYTAQPLPARAGR